MVLLHSLKLRQHHQSEFKYLAYCIQQLSRAGPEAGNRDLPDVMFIRYI